MTHASERRQFLKGIAGLAAAGTLPVPIARALALPTNRCTGSIRDVEHIVILMQENRSFDHYYGTLRGVRGYGDPRPLMLRSGDSVFRQPTPDGRGKVLPFHLDSRTTRAPVMQSLDHSWKGNAAEWAEYDVWIKHKTPLTMGHFTRADIPFYHALADAFTIGDNYFCSIHGPTNPNRLFLFSGTSGLGAGHDGKQCVENVDDGNWTGDIALDKPGFAAFGWTTFAERLQAAGVSWKVYQEFDNYGDNPLAGFANYRGTEAHPELIARGRSIVAGSTAENAPATTAQHLVDVFSADVAANRLPQVSWIVAPYAYCEHPEAPPQYGEALVARLIDALIANPEVWSKTALIINYDENDGFFDHVPAPLPAVTRDMGLSTVDVRGETWGGQAMGLGIRVPLLVVSPWTRGGWVNSQVFDHTSVIRFIGARFGVEEPNITPWRRTVTGDLTTMFDFADPDRSALSALPSIKDYLARIAASAKLPKPTVPTEQAMPQQEPGQRPARALPYALAAHQTAAVTAAGLPLEFVNEGGTGAVFASYAAEGGPWFHTIEAGKQLTDAVPAVAADGSYALAVRGPNGFLREFAGSAAAPELVVIAQFSADRDEIVLTLANRDSAVVHTTVRQLAYGCGSKAIALRPDEMRTIRRCITGSDHWYDLAVEAKGGFRRRFAGHVETGRPSRSDPAIGYSIA